MTESTKRRVCVVGAGAAGLCAARHLAGDLTYDFRVYEQTKEIGGTWVYREETGLDEYGLAIHSSMYRDLRTNLPGRIMNFPDYQRMNNEQPACITHQEVRAYLQGYAEHFDLVKHIQFNRKVECIRLQVSSDNEEQWIVRTKNLKSNETEEGTFDAVMICNGHYFDPYVPSIPGVESFPGTIMHSHSYRKPEEFAGKIVLILGAASSGIDIGIELSRHASQVYLSHNGERLKSALPTNMTQVMGIERIDGQKFFLKDQTSVTADVFLFCTGYRFSYPFLDESCGIRVDENYVTPLYKHLINIEHPTMCIVGVPMIVIPFPMFHVQVQYFLATLKKAILPSRSAMLEDSRLKQVRKRHAHKLMEKQCAYYDSLADAGGFDRLPIFYKIGYEIWSTRGRLHLLRYKDSRFVISDDGQNVELVIPN